MSLQSTKSSNQIIAITPAAAAQIKTLIAARNKPSLGIRIGVQSGGCSGLKYKFEYADSLSPGEELIEEHGVSVIIEPNAVLYIMGTTLDFIDEKVKSGFTFINPNAKASCGCGESFAT